MAETKTAWHTLEADEALCRLGTPPGGLTAQEAGERLARFGPNRLQEAERPSPWLLFLEQFKNFLIIILLVAVVISALLGDMLEAGLILAIVLFAAGLGFVQEHRAERAMEALARMAAPTATVRRDGQEMELRAEEVVPGDLLVIRDGDRIAADARLLEVANLKVNEAPLTGESVPVEKATSPLPGEDLPLGDRRNMAFSGTSAVYGRGTGVVVATGMSTQFGQIAGMLQEVETPETPLQKSLDRLGKWIAIAALGIVALIFLLETLSQGASLEMFIWAVSLAVAAVPEALPAVVTITLALGVQRMVKRHALIRHLPAVETLGSTTIICSDKTGTLTQDQMTVRQLLVDGELVEVTGTGYEPSGEFLREGQPLSPQSRPLRLLLGLAALCNDSALAQQNSTWTVRGDPTEGALVVAAAKAGLDKEALEKQFPRVGEIPFSSERKRMTTIQRTPWGRLALAKGAPEVIVASCSHYHQEGQELSFAPEQQQRVLEANHRMAEQALRVLAFAYKRLEDGEEKEAAEAEKDMVFVGLAGMIDPPREEVKEAVARCQEAGIRVVMITGDHPLTAQAIARELGLHKGELTFTGADLNRLGDAELEGVAEQVEVYARVSPAHKFRVVTALANRGHIVAMTGDGVNDAPALKKADIGIAMGITGTDVAKEASAMVLTDDNFASIVAAVEEGRGILSNVRKFLMYLFAANLGELLLVLGAALLRLPLPLTALQLLFINLVTDGLPALALAADPISPGIMKQPPRRPGEFILRTPHLLLVALGGTWLALVNLGLFFWALRTERGVIAAQALIFVTVILIEYFKAFVFRSDRESIFAIGPFANRWLVASVVLNILLMLPLFYFPFLQEPFHTFPLELGDWALAVGLALTVVPVLEIGKALRRRLWR